MRKKPNKKISVFIFSVSMLTMSACASSMPVSEGTEKTEEKSVPPLAQATDFATSQIAASSTNQFAVDLYSKLSQGEKNNLVFSPYSIVSALAMTYAGARENTQSQIANTLRFSAAQTEIHQAFSALNELLIPKNDGYQLKIANALWKQQESSTLGEEFVKTLQQFYGARVEQVDFQSAPETARNQINQWIETKTNHKINNLLQPGTVGANTKLILSNALYFNGSWAIPFDEKETQLLPFHHDPDSEPVNVPTLSGVGFFNYFNNEKMEGLELPYKGRNLSLVILLPKAGKKLNAVSPQLWLSKLEQSFKETVVKVLLPKFKIESVFELKDYLKALQMTDAFIVGKADFSGIDNTKELVLSAVVHKTFIEVNEKGTEAAAASAVITSRGGKPIPELTLHINRPFLFLVREKSSGTILFLGQVFIPS